MVTALETNSWSKAEESDFVSLILPLKRSYRLDTMKPTMLGSALTKKFRTYTLRLLKIVTMATSNTPLQVGLVQQWRYLAAGGWECWKPKSLKTLPQEKVLQDANWTDFEGFMKKSRRIFVLN